MDPSSTAQQNGLRIVDAGLLVIHGVGAHARSSMLTAVVDPLLSRLTEEGQLVNVTSLRAGTDDDLGGLCDALLIEYRPAEADLPSPSLRAGPSPTRGGEPRHGAAAEPEAPPSLVGKGAGGLGLHRPDLPRTLLAVEGRWNDVFLKAGPDRISSWVGRHAPRMMLELFRYHARGWLWLPALVSLALLGAAVAASQRGDVLLPLGLFLLSLGVAVATVWTDVRDVQGKAPTLEGRVSVVAVVATMVIYQLQRGLVLIVTAAGIVLLPLAAALLRLLSSVPFLGALSRNMLRGIESALLSGGIADMEAVAENHVTAAAIRTRLRAALCELETRVRPGGTITVVAHSGGAPPAWRLLSEPEIFARQAERRFRYRLLTVGAALNWAKRGFANRATPLDDPLVNHDRPPEERTRWLNVWSSWDPVPHGPAPAAEFNGWATWDGEPPNRMVRNLGAPVPAEHGEYWRNQQEFLPLLVRAIDEDVAWAARDAGPDQQLWSNCRLALLSALVRARLVIIAVPVAAVIAMLRGIRFIQCDGDGAVYRSGLFDFAGRLIRTALEQTIGPGGYTAVRDAVCGSPLIAGALVVAALALVAYALLDVYTSYLWQSLGRRVTTLRPTVCPPPRIAVPLRGALLVWLPTLILLPALLYPFHLGTVAWTAITVTNTVVAVLEFVWFNTCLRAFCDDTLRPLCETRFGRQRPAAQVETPAGRAALA